MILQSKSHVENRRVPWRRRVSEPPNEFSEWDRVGEGVDRCLVHAAKVFREGFLPRDGSPKWDDPRKVTHRLADRLLVSVCHGSADNDVRRPAHRASAIRKAVSKTVKRWRRWFRANSREALPSSGGTRETDFRRGFSIARGFTGAVQSRCAPSQIGSPERETLLDFLGCQKARSAAPQPL